MPTGNVARFFRQQQARAAATHWQLLQLAPTAVPGTFRAWVLVDTALYAGGCCPGLPLGARVGCSPPRPPPSLAASWPARARARARARRWRGPAPAAALRTM
jgi:hypothetical protein